MNNSPIEAKDVERCRLRRDQPHGAQHDQLGVMRVLGRAGQVGAGMAEMREVSCLTRVRRAGQPGLDGADADGGAVVMLGEKAFPLGIGPGPAVHAVGQQFSKCFLSAGRRHEAARLSEQANHRVAGFDIGVQLAEQGWIGGLQVEIGLLHDRATGLAQFARQGFAGLAKLAGDRGQKDGLARHDGCRIARIAARRQSVRRQAIAPRSDPCFKPRLPCRARRHRSRLCPPLHPGARPDPGQGLTQARGRRTCHFTKPCSLHGTM